MLGQRKQLEPKLFYSGFTLGDRIPADHLLRRIREQVDFQFVRDHVRHLYGDCGHESLDPIVLVKLMLLLFLEQVKSERALMEQMGYRLDWLWFCEYDLDEPIPDHSVLSKARRRWGRDVFVTLFQQVLRQCVDAGLVDGRLVYVDGSLIRADAAMAGLHPDLRLISESLYTQLEEQEEEAQASATSEPPPDPPSGAMISDTDPDARMTRKNGQTVLGYKEHRVVDDAHGIVTATITTDASISEAHQLIGVLNEHRWNTGCLEETVVADKGYGTQEAYKGLHDRGVTPCIPHQRHGGTHGTYSSEKFTYDRRQDCYVCPAGHQLKPKARRQRKNGRPVRYYAEKEVCSSCPLRAECTKNAAGRTVIRDPDQKYVEWADGCGSRAARRRLLGRRLAVGEGSFADASNNHHFKRARWRRLWRVEIQNLLVATAQNLRKLVGIKRAQKPEGPVSKVLGRPLRALEAAIEGTLRLVKRSWCLWAESGVLGGV
jgi:IS5 family transposase